MKYEAEKVIVEQYNCYYRLDLGIVFLLSTSSQAQGLENYNTWKVSQ